MKSGTKTPELLDFRDTPPLDIKFILSLFNLYNFTDHYNSPPPDCDQLPTLPEPVILRPKPSKQANMEDIEKSAEKSLQNKPQDFSVKR